MTPAQVSTLIKGRLANRTDDTDLDAIILTELNATVEQLELGPFYPWFMRKTSQFSAIGPDVSAELPADFIVKPEEEPVIFEDSTGNRWELKQRDRRELEKFAREDGAHPRFFALADNSMLFYPEGDAGMGTVSFAYFGKSTPLTTIVDATYNRWFHDAAMVLVGRTGQTIAAQYLKDAELAQLAGAQAQEAYQQLKFADTARTEMARDHNVIPLGRYRG